MSLLGENGRKNCLLSVRLYDSPIFHNESSWIFQITLWLSVQYWLNQSSSKDTGTFWGGRSQFGHLDGDSEASENIRSKKRRISTASSVEKYQGPAGRGPLGVTFCLKIKKYHQGTFELRELLWWYWLWNMAQRWSTSVYYDGAIEPFYVFSPLGNSTN